MKREHLDVKWIVGEDEDAPFIATDEPEPWYIARARFGLPGDVSGEATLQYICDLHNRELEKREKGS